MPPTWAWCTQAALLLTAAWARDIPQHSHALIRQHPAFTSPGVDSGAVVHLEEAHEEGLEEKAKHDHGVEAGGGDLDLRGAMVERGDEANAALLGKMPPKDRNAAKGRKRGFKKGSATGAAKKGKRGKKAKKRGNSTGPARKALQATKSGPAKRGSKGKPGRKGKQSKKTSSAKGRVKKGSKGKRGKTAKP